MGKSEKPIHDKTPHAYESGAKLTMTEPLQKSDSWSTSEGNLTRQREEAHRQALESEEKHLSMIYPFYEPRGSFASKKKRGE